MVSISRALSRIKDQSLQGDILDTAAVDRVFLDLDHRWRQRTLGPAQTMELFIRQIIEANAPCAAVRHMAGGDFTASAYCQARARLPLAGVWRISRQVCDQLRGEHDEPAGRWHGHRTFHIDGTGISMADTPPLQEAFGQPGQQAAGCGFPVAHLLVLFDARSGMALEAIPAPLRTHDLADAHRLHPNLCVGDVLVGDCAFGSWAHLALLAARGLHGVFPLHQRRLGPKRDGDRIETWTKPPNKPVWISDEDYTALPQAIRVRVVRRTIRQRGLRPRVITLVTTLLDQEAYAAQELVELGRGRWSAETSLRHLKTTLGLEVLRCKTVQGVLKELAVFLLVYNLVRAAMLNAARQQGVAVDRISFADALRFIRWTRADAALYILMVNPKRPGRIEPRVVKRRHDKYARMTKPRWKLRQMLKVQGHAA